MLGGAQPCGSRSVEHQRPYHDPPYRLEHVPAAKSRPLRTANRGEHTPRRTPIAPEDLVRLSTLSGGSERPPSRNRPDEGRAKIILCAWGPRPYTPAWSDRQRSLTSTR